MRRELRKLDVELGISQRLNLAFVTGTVFGAIVTVPDRLSPGLKPPALLFLAREGGTRNDPALAKREQGEEFFPLFWREKKWHQKILHMQAGTGRARPPVLVLDDGNIRRRACQQHVPVFNGLVHVLPCVKEAGAVGQGK